MRNPVVQYGNYKDADQPAYSLSPIWTISIRCLFGTMPVAPLVLTVCVACYAGLCLIWAETPKTVSLVT